MSEEIGYCTSCRGEGLIHTGIDEAPVTQCSRCDGTGELPVAAPLPAAPSPPKITPEHRAAIHAKVLALGYEDHMICAPFTPTLSNDEIDSITRHFKQADHHDSIRACIAAALASQPVAALPAEQVSTELPPLPEPRITIAKQGDRFFDLKFYGPVDAAAIQTAAFEAGRRAALAARQAPTGEAESDIALLPFAIFDDELAALRRFDECARDGADYDVDDKRMRRLAEIASQERGRKGGIVNRATMLLALIVGEYAMLTLSDPDEPCRPQCGDCNGTRRVKDGPCPACAPTDADDVPLD